MSWKAACARRVDRETKQNLSTANMRGRWMSVCRLPTDAPCEQEPSPCRQGRNAPLALLRARAGRDHHWRLQHGGAPVARQFPDAVAKEQPISCFLSELHVVHLRRRQTALDFAPTGRLGPRFCMLIFRTPEAFEMILEIFAVVFPIQRTAPQTSRLTRVDAATKSSH